MSTRLHILRPVFCHTTDCVPVFRVRKGGSSGRWLTCWFSLEPTQLMDDDGVGDAFDARRLEAAPKDGMAIFEDDAFRAALMQSHSAELRALIKPSRAV